MSACADFEACEASQREIPGARSQGARRTDWVHWGPEHALCEFALSMHDWLPRSSAVSHRSSYRSILESTGTSEFPRRTSRGSGSPH
eukprot:scaffold2666_cov562-Prasinococcus_capsulatus_cf.AAC.7